MCTPKYNLLKTYRCGMNYPVILILIQKIGFRHLILLVKVTPSPNSGSSYAGQNFYTVIRNFLTYNHNFNKFQFDALAGHEAQESTFENVGGGRRNFASDNVQAH
jgi:hypothetical protein